MSGPIAPALLVAAMSCVGCGGTLYAVEIGSAEGKIAQAKELGAEQLAPYEYYYAREHLTQAMSEASEADYSDAVEFARVANTYVDKAIQRSRDAHSGAER